jgi:hypothetical protein
MDIQTEVVKEVKAPTKTKSKGSKTKSKGGKGKVLVKKKDERVGDFCRRLIKAYRGTNGHTHKTIAAIAKKNFPKSAVDSSHIAYYVCKMKEKGTLTK